MCESFLSLLGSPVADCKQPPELEHGYVTFSTSNNLTTYQSGIQYSCQRPYYQMVPNVTGVYTCDAQGVWISAELGTHLPSCQPGTEMPLTYEPWKLSARFRFKDDANV
uniref:Mannan-binding lectin serine protease 1 n=1 Tax=Sphaerodactylus townsendi TaxID=933632 RepID=A0ACB8FC10_9SAUR